MSNTAIIFGVFDLTHWGHYHKFAEIKRKYDKLTVIVVGDTIAESYKRIPYLHQLERLANVYACRWVDYCCLAFQKSEYSHLAKDVDVIIYGEDWTEDEYMKLMEFPEEFREKLVQMPRIKGISTSEIIERIQERA